MQSHGEEALEAQATEHEPLRGSAKKQSLWKQSHGDGSGSVSRKKERTDKNRSAPFPTDVNT